jgi:hypothetical protein
MSDPTGKNTLPLTGFFAWLGAGLALWMLASDV